MKILYIIACVVLVRADFAVVGDWGRSGTPDQFIMANTLADMNLEFIISTGDNFYPTGLTSVQDSQAHDWVHVYNSRVPWYICLGNHDYYGNVQAQLDMDGVYSMWNLPARYYTISKGDVDFWFLDTTPLLDFNPVWKTSPAWLDLEFQREKAQDQYAWLETTLRESNASRKIIVGHHPLWTFGEHMHQTSDDFRDYIVYVMKEYNVESYICGHDHNLQHVTNDGIHVFISGSGAMTFEWDWYTGGRSFDEAVLEYGDSDTGFMVVSGREYAFHESNGGLKYVYNFE